MSTFKDILADMSSVLFPSLCPICGDELLDNEHFFCTACRFRAPQTNFCRNADNPMTRRLEGLLPVERASAFIWFIDGSPWQDFIHRFKYSDRWLYARQIGEWFGSELAESGLYNDIDLVVPIPLHPIKRMKRTYNQSEYLADGVAAALGAKVDRHSVIRHVNNSSQTTRSEHERWENVEEIFSVRRPDALRNKHILLVDDVFTTGATIVSCGNAIIRALGQDNVRISVATLATTQRSMAIDK